MIQFGLLRRAISSPVNALANQCRNYIVPSIQRKTVKVYSQTPRLVPKGKHAMDIVNERLYARYDRDGAKRAMFDRDSRTRPLAGDLLRVTKVDGSQIYGMLLAHNRNHLGSTLLLRTKIGGAVGGTALENRVQIFNPIIKSVEIMRIPYRRFPKTKHYFVRNNKYHDVRNVEHALRKDNKI